MSARWRAKFLPWLVSNWSYIKLAIKGSVPPGILVCLIASDTWLNHFQANSVFAPVIAACALPILPRARLLSLHIRLAFSFALTYAYCLLAGWCGAKARQNTESPNTGTHQYNGSAEAVVAIYFVFYFWACFTLKSAFPTWQLPCVLSGLYAAAVLPSVAEADDMDKILKTADIPIEAFFAGLALALVSGIVVLPGSCRDAFFNDMRKCLKELVDMGESYSKLMVSFANDEKSDTEGVLVSQLKCHLQAFVTNANALNADLPWAMREVAWSLVSQGDLISLHSLISNLVPALSGLVSVADILQRTRRRDVIQSKSTSQTSESKDQSETYQHRDTLQWRQAQKDMHNSCKVMSEIVSHAIRKALEQFEKAVHSKSDAAEIGARGGKTNDIESTQEAQTFDADSISNQPTCSQLTVIEKFTTCKSWLQQLDSQQQHNETIHYFMVLNQQHILQKLASDTIKLTEAIDVLSQKPKRLVIPTLYNRKSAQHITVHPPPIPGSTQTIKCIANAAHQIFCSKHAGFGLRGACAMMSIGIIAFLSSSTTFYSEQRFLWALYAILLSLNETAGSSTLSLCLRFAGTLSSMIAAYLIWYVPDQHTAGILVLLWVWFIVLGYLYARFPRVQSAWFVALIAAIVMVANELQVRRLGVAAVEAAGQAVYKPYILFPYRLAIVTLGIVVAYFWTLFPIPLTEHRELCRNLALATTSLSRLHLAIQERIQVSLSGHGMRDDDLRYHGEKLSESRRQHLSDFARYKNAAASFVKFLDWEFTLKTRLSKHTATKIIEHLEQIASHMSLIENVAASLKPADNSEDMLKTNRNMVFEHLCPNGLTSRLIEISNALETSQPLAPDLQDLKMPDLTDFLGLDCLADRRVAIAVLIHTTNWYMIQSLKELTGLIANVVGTVNFMV